LAELHLAEFQRAAVTTISDRLLDRSGPRRFLLADEVGLGKTIVARGVLEEMLRRRRNKGLVVVYLCSNAEIADQNRTKLDPEAGPSVRRITRLATDAPPDKPLKMYSFTPWTSLSDGTGLSWERQLLLFLAYRLLRVDIRKGQWREFFRCGAGPTGWGEVTQFRALRNEFNRKLSVSLQRRIEEAWRTSGIVDGVAFTPTEHLEEAVTGYDEGDPDSKRRRNRIIGLLRTHVQRVLLDELQPDLVILDEVQRFNHVIRDAGAKASIAARLFEKGAAVLILSATPYRMLSLEHEGDGHYDEFLDMVKFLFANRGAAEIEGLAKDLGDFRTRLEEGLFLKGPDSELLGLKSKVECRLRKVMSRTERNWYVHEHGKGVEELLPSGDQFSLPRQEELADFIRLRGFLLDKVETPHHITEYWKSCPAPFTFMDAQYAPMAATRKSRAALPPHVVASATQLGRLSQRSLRFRELFRLLFGEADKQWRYLWTRPSYTYYKDEFFHDADPRKVLVFSGWRFVPKAIALLTSHEAEQRIAPHGRLWEADDRPPLRFTEKGSFHIFDVCFPSPALARLLDPATVASQNLSSRELLKQTEKRLTNALQTAGVEIAETSRSPVWQVVARLEKSTDAGVVEALEACGAYKGKDVTERFGEHADEFIGWAESDNHLRISRDRLRHVARVATFSPAVSLLRAFWSVYPATAGQVPPGLLDLCFDSLRSYFNRRTVRAIVERSVGAGRSYARAALEYCEEAHFQAVIDEHLYLARHVLQQGAPSDAADHLTRVFGIGTGTPNINVVTDTGRLRDAPVARRSHFALAFGDDLKSDQGSGLEQSQASRKTAVREAFNSPFWPFVLATTSIGQEGLDFHLFCRDIVHWNLPSNPVDLEQREGRINRRDGLALRRSIAKEWPLERVGRVVPEAEGNIWQRAFAAIESEPGIQRYKHGLYPHWVFDCEHTSTELIRRHLFFYADSQDSTRYEELKERLALYRLVFGQPRQQDLLDRIRRNLDKDAAGSVQHTALTRYMVNLSPIREEHADARAAAEATRVVDSAKDLVRLLNDVERIASERSEELLSVKKELELLMALVRAYVPGNKRAPSRVFQAVQALVYLRDPYDAVLDQHVGLGLEDDVDRIRIAASPLIASTRAQRIPA